MDILAFEGGPWTLFEDEKFTRRKFCYISVQLIECLLVSEFARQVMSGTVSHAINTVFHLLFRHFFCLNLAFNCIH